MVHCIRKTNACLFALIGETAFQSSRVPYDAVRCLRGSRLFCLLGKGFGTRTGVIRAIDSSRVCVTVSHEGSVDRPKFLDPFSSLDLVSGNCSIINTIALRKSAIERNCVHSRMHRLVYLPRGLPRTSPVIVGYS